MVDGVEIRTLPFGREEFEQDCQASSSYVLECIGSYGIENEQEVVSPFKFSKLSVSHSEELRDEIEDDVSRFKKTGEDAISGRLESQSHIATLGPAKPAVEDPCIRTVYDVKYMDFDRSRAVKPQGVFKLRYQSKESLKALLVVRWDNAAIKRKPTIKIESDDEDVVKDVAENVAESVIKRERDEYLVESSMPATRRARSRRN
ncbi:hypothetical protein BCON_0040g00550 [Botryotinia convoluta]|uniref:Uncharacterized protein n=1 Tax=Botryotinia convoluta TaxID=54673 RepID=A0A4Z1IK84_9HELO|nr:hypothetical protein BCON_0040g00550 [Botryotinia convoluta]